MSWAMWAWLLAVLAGLVFVVGKIPASLDREVPGGWGSDDSGHGGQHNLGGHNGQTTRPGPG